MKPQIINIINFIRGAEPRDASIDLIKPVQEQINILKKYDLPATFLVQYDAIIRPELVELLKKELSERYEIGGWLEIDQNLVEKAGMTWRGRDGFSWDWHANAGFSVGYTPEERERLIDVFMSSFKDIFGKHPESIGSWIIDAHTLAYLEGKYGIIASCNCRDQWGTDGYTLWGGYYNQAYYPSRMNVFSPAQTGVNQINVPVFRMLGSDPIYQYDAGQWEGEIFNPAATQEVITLEAACIKGGASPEWVNWFFKENFNGKCLSFGYAQAGQENSFGWDIIKNGFELQMPMIKEKFDRNEVMVKTLKETGRWFKSKYEFTPASAVVALNDPLEHGNKSVWYYNQNYRVNFFWHDKKLRIRDIHFFSELYEERYLYETCKKECFIYDNLPIIDGNRWSKDLSYAGIYPVKYLPDGTFEHLSGKDPCIEEKSEDELIITWPFEEGGRLEICCRPEEMAINCSYGENVFQWGMVMMWNNEANTSISNIKNDEIRFLHNNFNYYLVMSSGYITKTECSNSLILNPGLDGIVIRFGS